MGDQLCNAKFDHRCYSEQFIQLVTFSRETTLDSVEQNLSKTTYAPLAADLLQQMREAMVCVSYKKNIDMS